MRWKELNTFYPDIYFLCFMVHKLFPFLMKDIIYDNCSIADTNILKNVQISAANLVVASGANQMKMSSMA